MSDNLIDIVKLAIKQDFHLVADDLTLLIKEKHPDAQCKFVEIKLEQSIDYFGFSLHKDKGKGNNDPVYPFFNPQYEGICSKDDGILFLQKSNKVYVLLIEMKSTNTKGYLKQLKAAKSFVEFVLQRIKIFNDQINTEVEFRGLLFSCRRIPNEGESKKQEITKQKLTFKDRNGLLVSENPGNNTYYIQQFLEKID
jgi:TPP-dependent 2-oxoacid decarboxylase